MNLEERQLVIHKFLNKYCFKTLFRKGKDYSSKDEDVNKIFGEIGDLVGIDNKYKVLMVYLHKHYSAISSWIARGKVESEPIEERICDAVNYLLIMYSMIYEDRLLTPDIDEVEHPFDDEITEKYRINEINRANLPSF